MSDFTIEDAPAPPKPSGQFKIEDGPSEPNAAPQKPMSAGDVIGSAISNIPSSAMHTVASMATPLIHPIDTATSLAKTVVGEGELATGFRPVDPAAQNSETYANAVNHYFGERYGSIEGFKKAVATDPVGVAADISMLFTGGAEAGARAPGIVGDVARATSKVGHALNPANAVAKVASKVSPVGAEIIGRLGTHTGGEAIKQAYRAGAEGGEASKRFLDHIRGHASVDEIVNSARRAVSKMRQARSSAYRAGMDTVSGDKAILDFRDIDEHTLKTAGVKNFKGQDLAPETKDVRDQVTKAIRDWKLLPPQDFHTVEGMDALKQRIGSIRDSLPYNTPERLIADNAYNAVRETITKQAPVYAKVMRDYEQASSELDEMQKTLSLNPKASIDTASRKLLSIMRDNVNTNYGRRMELGKVLQAHGAPHLASQLAGETMKAPVARGLGTLEMGGTVLGGLAGGSPHLLAALPFMSPRLVGEASHYLGAASRKTDRAAEAALVSRALGGTNPQ